MITSRSTLRRRLAVLAVLCALGAALGFGLPETAVGQALGQHCVDIGPLPEPPPGWCGCTWGAVYVEGKPVTGARVTLSFAGHEISDTTLRRAGEPFPYYGMSADLLGAKYGDVVTIRATYAGRTVEQAVRLVPGGTGEQRLGFAFPASGHWEPWADLPGVQALAAGDHDLWAGTASGLYRWDLVTGVVTPEVTGLASNNIRALLLAADGSAWAGSPAGLARRRNGAWSPAVTGLASADIRALAGAVDGSVWAGAGGATTGGVSRFDGTSWHPQPDFNGSLPNLVLALAVDGRGHLWVGTDDAGASRWDGTRWETFTTADGLATNIVLALAADSAAVWLGGYAYTDTTGAHGGVARYGLAGGGWSRYAEEDGLAAGDVLAAAIDHSGRQWFATPRGVSLFDGHNWWTFTRADGLTSDHVRALNLGPDGTLWAGSSAGVDRFLPGAGGEPPVVTAPEIEQSGTGTAAALLFRAEASDPDGDPLVGFAWTSDRDGALGSEASFGLPAARLSAGLHRISVRALDARGAWSAPATAQVVVVHPRSAYLPVSLR